MTKPGMNVKQRDIILIPVPFSDLSTSKRRPAIVISNSAVRCPFRSLRSLKQTNLRLKISSDIVELGDHLVYLFRVLICAVSERSFHPVMKDEVLNELC